MVRRHFAFTVCVLVMLALAACGDGDNAPPVGESPSGTVEPTVLAARKPPFEWGACQFDIPVGVTVDCGYLTVPEDRSRPDGPTIRLHVGVFESESETPAADPVLYLGGGPGENSTEATSLIFEQRIKPFLETREYIVLDQRGTGFSRPSLDCPELDSAFKEHIDEDLTREEERSLHQEAIFKCRDRLANEGVNLAAYRSVESAADVNDLRLALGHDSWNIHGVSYGTRLALTVMRDFPEGVRSVILDSTYPPQQSLYAAFPANARRAFDTFFNGCIADPACDATYPSLESVFFGTVEQLNAAPITESIANPLTGETFDVTVIDGDVLMEFLFQALYSTELIPLLPRIISDVANGDTSLMASILGSFFAQSEELFTPGMHFSVQCSDEVSLTAPEEVADGNAAYPELLALTAGDAFSGEGVFAVCQGWGSATADQRENQPVSSDIPALVLAGEYDPITPPEWGQQAADTLSRHYFHVFPGIGHGVATAHECPQSITMAFLADPSVGPDASCLGGDGRGGVGGGVEGRQTGQTGQTDKRLTLKLQTCEPASRGALLFSRCLRFRGAIWSLFGKKFARRRFCVREWRALFGRFVFGRFRSVGPAG